VKNFVSAHHESIAFMMTSTLLYAFLNLCVKFLPHIPAVELIFFRSLISFVICATILFKQRVPLLGKNKKWLIIRGLAGIAALWSYFYTIQHVPLAEAVTFQYMSPVFTAILAGFILSERMSTREWLLLLLAMLGVFIIQGFDHRVSWYYVAIGLFSALASGLAYNAVRKLNSSEHPLVIILYFPLVALPVTGAVSATQWVMPTGLDWLYILAMGLFTQGGQYFMTKAIQQKPLSQLTYLNYLGIVYALVLGFLCFNETFHPAALFGMLLVCSGVLLNLRLNLKSEAAS
jgi:drug/metabolite transporter (DMT)-like permease